MGDISLLDWSEDTAVSRACHPDYPAQPATPEGHVNQALLGEWPLAERRQPPQFSDYPRQDVCRRWRHIVPGVPDFVSDGSLCAARRGNTQLRRVVLLRLKQDQERESFDGVVVHVL